MASLPPFPSVIEESAYPYGGAASERIPASIAAEVPSRETMTDQDRDGRLRAAVGAHFDFVWRTLRRAGLSTDLADDGAQQVFLVLSRRLSDVDSERERPFLYGTALRVASDLRRAAPRRREVPTDPFAESLDGPSHEPAPDALVEQRRARALLERALARLDADHREVLVLYEMEEFSTREIAEIMSIPQGTVKSRLRLAREAFESVVHALKGAS